MLKNLPCAFPECRYAPLWCRVGVEMGAPEMIGAKDRVALRDVVKGKRLEVWFCVILTCSEPSFYTDNAFKQVQWEIIHVCLKYLMAESCKISSFVSPWFQGSSVCLCSPRQGFSG